MIYQPTIDEIFFQSVICLVTKRFTYVFSNVKLQCSKLSQLKDIADAIAIIDFDKSRSDSI